MELKSGHSRISKAFKHPAGLSLFAMSALSLALSACAPASSEKDKFASVNLKIKSSSLNTASTLTLAPELCYIVHITGERLMQKGPDSRGCGPAEGLGQLSPNAYSRGQTAELEVLIGPRRKFDLIGVAPPQGVDASGNAICGKLETQIIFENASNPSAYKIRATINGQPVGKPPIIFYSGIADVVSGLNTVELNPIPHVVTPLTSAYAFGAPYDRQHLPNSNLSAVCGEFNRSMNTPLMTSSSAVIENEISSTENPNVTLKIVTSVPNITTAPIDATTSNQKLRSGLGEIIHGK